SFESCCKCGDTMMERMRVLPEPLNYLLTSQDDQSRLFRQDLRRWNNLLAFTSIRYNHDDRASAIGEGFNLFQIHGTVYHHQGPLVLKCERDALYSQVYLYDPAFAVQSSSARLPE
ncbi:hypothetical protein HOY82DRAFT_492929, partial [Tuber indicum]